MQGTRRARIESIDLLRGVVILLMALDHVRMYLAYGTWWAEPTNLDTTTPLLFFTRWITHFCAPVFLFLAGTSAYLYGARQPGTRPLSRYLLKRGLWLIFLELVIVNLGWTFDITLGLHLVQVIWAIGASMVVLAGLVYLPKWVILAFGLVLVVGHNLLDPIQMGGTTAPALTWYILHQNILVAFGPKAAVYFHYPLIPLLGLMALGYVFGTLYRPEFGAERRRRWLLWAGTAAILLFLVLRGLNLYGDPNPWSPQPTAVYSILSFMNTTKYPASLHFLLMTIGPALVFLALTERVKSPIAGIVLTYGRVSLFFYLVHIYAIHLLALLALEICGRSRSEYIFTVKAFMGEVLADFGLELYVVYLVWALVLSGMYPLSKWYRGYKKRHPELKLLAYL
jgi:uncharacterized membrane protein